MRSILAAGLALGLAVCSGAAAAPVGGFTSFWTLGDSLSDDGNLYRATGGAVPAPPYWEGRVSNGRVWAEHVADDFAAKGLATENFAYAYAAVGSPPFRPIGAPPVVDLGGQVAAFGTASAGKLGAKPLASLWFGANDLFFGGIPTGQARKVGRAAADGVAAGALVLNGLGVRDVLLFNMPALDKTPAFLFGGEAERAQARIGTRAFNRQIDAQADKLRAAGMNVYEVDVFSLSKQLFRDPEAFGVLSSTLPCYVPGSGAPACANPELLAYFDPVHPNSVIHGAIADVVRAEVAPVPLPAAGWLLVAGAGALAFAGRRRARRAAA
jgi:phospholipase/lecithinase/hemolysin